MKVLLTGITGFIGHHLGERLLDNGDEVFAIVRPTSKIDELSEKLRRNVKFFTYDNDNTVLDIVTDLCVAGNRPDLVFHLAAWLLRSSYKFENIKDLIQSNITFGTELLEAMAKNGIKNFVNTGTISQHYENADYNPMNLYAATKQSFEDIIKFYSELLGLHCISLHLGHPYGGENNGTKVFTALKKSILTGEPAKVSPGGQLIDAIYIDDIIDAFILAGKYLVEKKYNYCGTYGVSSMNPITIRKFVEIAEEMLGRKISVEWGSIPYRQREVMEAWKNFKTLPGWSPKVNLREGIKKFLEV